MKWLLLLFSTSALAQSITIPAQNISTKVTINGTPVTISMTVPAQTVALPTSSGSGLPSGMTYANNVLTVAGSISTPSISLTGGPTLPTSANGLYVWQLANGILEPVAFPAIAVSSSTANTVTLTP